MSKRVPAKLHHELVEYASLLRALRVRDTLDVTKHLTRANPFKIRDDEELDSVSRSHSLESSTLSPKAKGKQKAGDSSTQKQRRRDHWTRWPVRVDDVLKPEWSLEDEVAVIVSQVMKGRESPTFPVPVDDPDAYEDEDDPTFPVRDVEFDEEDPDHPFYVPYIAANVAHFLSNILGNLACAVPPRTASMQNRIEPLGWRAIVDVVVASQNPEFSNPKVVENVIKRMEALYGPSILPLEGPKSTSFRAVERIRAKAAAREKINNTLNDEVDKYWETPVPEIPETPEEPPQKARRKKRKLAMDKHLEAEFKGHAKPVPKKKPRALSRRKKAQSAVIMTQDTGDPQSATVDAALEEPPQPQAGPSNLQEAAPRRSTRVRRTAEIQVLDDSIFN
ncbi:hypothetical protein BDN70DRAFT_328644 [Pholiota conissans]|uniref:Uncharacterized protein n=1 Tax=Pholiota conissans TaxID=109636 RepID=A0A9P5ZAK4_9AGAR|nr:hypothetical protein BDN70DRAFT_328644 [Pholiota conissans]